MYIYINWNLYSNILLNDCMASPILITLHLKRLGIDTLEKRRLYCDLTLCYKMLYSHSTLHTTL